MNSVASKTLRILHGSYLLLELHFRFETSIIVEILVYLGDRVHTHLTALIQILVHVILILNLVYWLDTIELHLILKIIAFILYRTSIWSIERDYWLYLPCQSNLTRKTSLGVIHYIFLYFCTPLFRFVICLRIPI